MVPAATAITTMPNRTPQKALHFLLDWPIFTATYRFDTEPW
jgi:hypothetical protein